MTSGLTTTSTFSTTNTLLQPDFWQEMQVRCLRFPFKDFSQPSFNSASYSITQRKEAFSLPPSCHHTTFWTDAPFCPIWTWRNVSSGGIEVHQGGPGCSWASFTCCSISPLPSPSASCLAIKAESSEEFSSQQTGNKGGKGPFPTCLLGARQILTFGLSSVRGPARRGEVCAGWHRRMRKRRRRRGKATLRGNGSVTTLWPSQLCGCDMQSPAQLATREEQSKGLHNLTGWGWNR